MLTPHRPNAHTVQLLDENGNVVFRVDTHYLGFRSPHADTLQRVAKRRL